MNTFTKEFQEELFCYLISEEGFNKFGLLLPKDVFTLDYLELSWDEVKKFYYTYSKLPTKVEIVEMMNSIPIASKVKEFLLEKLKELLNSNMEINTSFISDRLMIYLKEVNTEKAISRFLDDREVGVDTGIVSLIKELQDINNMSLPEKEDFFGGILGRLERYKKGVDTDYIDIGLGNISIARGEIGVALAPPKRGKSLFLVSAGYGALISGHKVLHITLELRKKSVELRYDRAISGLTKTEILNTSSDKIVSIFAKIKKLGGGVDIYEAPASKTGIETIYGLVNKEYKEGNPYDLLVIDYADLLKPSRYYKDRRFELSLIYTELRSLASEFNLAVWTASQTRRDTFGSSTITMEDVAEDIGKVAICDMIVSICQTQEERSSKPEQGRLFITGAREKEDGVIVPCVIDRDLSRVLLRKGSYG